MSKSNFDRLMKRYLLNQVSEDEKIKIEAWMEVRKTEDTGDMELSREEAELLFQKITNKTSSTGEVRTLASVKKRHTTMWWTYRIAASLLVITIVSYLGWKRGLHDGSVTEIASQGNTEKVILKDGSLVWLKGSSNLRYENNYEEGIRYSELKGEALFEIAKDANHPFIIKCGDVTLKVVGTSFSVRNVNDSIELRVLTGKVNFSTTREPNGLDVSPNEKIVYGGGENIRKLTMNAGDAAAATEDTQYPMAFNETSLVNVLKALEMKFDVAIQLDNNKVGSCRVTVDLTDRSLAKSLEILADVLSITWKQEEKTIIVSGEGC